MQLARALVVIAFLLMSFIVLAQTTGSTSTTDLTTLQNQQQQLTLQQQIQQLTQQINSGSSNQGLQTQLDTLTLQKNIADAKLAITQDQINAAKTQIGAINTSGLPTGTAQLSSVDIQPTITAYEESRRSVRTVLAELYPGSACEGDACFERLNGDRVNLACPPRAVLWSPVLSDISVLSYFRTVVDAAAASLNEVQKPSYIQTGHVSHNFAPAVAFAAVDAVTALSALFKVDTTMTGVSITGDEDALRLLLLQELRTECGGTTLINPNNFNPDISATTILEALNNLDSAARHAQDVANQALSQDVTKFQAQIKALQTKQDQLDALVKEKAVLELKRAEAVKAADREELSREIESVQALITAASPPSVGGSPGPPNYLQQITDLQINVAQATAFATSVSAQLTKVASLETVLSGNDNTGTPLLVRLARAEALSTSLNGTPTLLLNIVKIGGNDVVKRHAFWTSIKFGGGSVLKYEQRSPDGLTVLKSGNVSVYAYRSESSHFGDIR